MSKHLSILFGAAALSVAAALPAGATATPRPIADPVIVDCSGHAVSSPRQFTLFCGDAGDTLSHLTWSHWGAARATATGLETLNSCRPDCAAGHYTHRRVSLSVGDRVDGRYRSLTVAKHRFDLTSRGPVLA